MRGILHGLALALAVAPAAGAGELLDLAAPSPALGRELPYVVYLPDAAAEPDARLPAIYLLHGYGGGRHEWVRGGRIDETLDQMIAEGVVAPVIAVMPEAGRSWYVDSARFGGPGDYATAIVRDLVTAVDAAHPTRAEPRSRAIAGLSMGGHGALRLAFAHPETFGAVAALSPGIWDPEGVSWQGGPLGETPEERERWYPRTTGERFDMETFKAQSPFAMLEAVGAMASPPRIFLASGDDDFFDLHDGTVEMYLALRRIGLEPELRIGDGGHDWAYWRSVVPEMLAFLDAGFGD
jgi:enterochelin esterase family protein